MAQTQQIIYAKGVRGRKGDVVLELADGRLGLPRGFSPQEQEWYLVEVVEDRQRYAIVRLHQHVDVGIGICKTCGRITNKNRLETFAQQWLGSMLRKERVREVWQIKDFMFRRFWELTVELGDMIYRLERERERRMVGEFVCPPGYPVVDSCFVYRCRDQYCEQLSYIIEYLRHVKDEVLEYRFQRVRQFSEPDRVMTVYTLGIEMVPVI